MLSRYGLSKLTPWNLAERTRDKNKLFTAYYFLRFNDSSKDPEKNK